MLQKKMIVPALTTMAGIWIGVSLFSNPQGAAQSTPKHLSQEEVVKIARKHAKDPGLLLEKIVLDNDDDDDDPVHYDIDMIINDVEHDFEIDALTGKVLKYEQKDRKAKQSLVQTKSSDDDGGKTAQPAQPAQPVQPTPPAQPAPQKPAQLTSDDAIEAARVASGYATLEVEYVVLDDDDDDDYYDDDDRLHYDIRAYAGGYRFDFEVDAFTGTVTEIDRAYLYTNSNNNRYDDDDYYDDDYYDDDYYDDDYDDDDYYDDDYDDRYDDDDDDGDDD